MPKASAQEKGTQRSSGDETRTRILVAAATLIAERGWGSVTTRAIAERAGVNQALVHYHFGNMDSLLREAVLARLIPEIQALADELLDDRPFPDGIHRTMQQLGRFDFDSEVGILMAEALLRATRDEDIAAAMGDVMSSWSALLEPRLVTAQERGMVRDDIDAGSLAHIIGAILDGFLIQRMADPDADPEAAATTLTQLLAPVREERR